MKPKPWSHSSLETFRTCPRKYYLEQVAKTAVDMPSPAADHGVRIHKVFENYLRQSEPLSPDLVMHEPFVSALKAHTIIGLERKVALDRVLRPTDFFAPDVWWRGVIDYQADLGNGRCLIVDYKTGKPHAKMEQLHLFALFAFVEGFEEADVQYYWTQTMKTTRVILPRSQAGAIISSFVPYLKEYVDAFKTDVWPAKRNGLCRNYCGGIDCEYNGR